MNNTDATANGPAPTVGRYLIERLRSHGVDHIFGVPGDFVLQFMVELEESGIKLINTCDEQGAGFAADAYARVKGLGVVCVTYGVGGLKVTNTTAQAFAELSPVVIISGAPSMDERERHNLIHHKVREFGTQKKVFDELTIAATVLDNAETAFGEIDRVIAAALRFKRPVYIEIPRDVVRKVGVRRRPEVIRMPLSDEQTLAVAVRESLRKINWAKQPVILAGEEIHRFRLQDELVQFVRRANIPVATSILGKSVIDESDPAYMGVYQGGIGKQNVRRYVEESDCIIMLGVMMTDMNLGIFTAQLKRANCIQAHSEKLSVGYHTYEEVQFADFMRRLTKADLAVRKLDHPCVEKMPPPYTLTDPDLPVTSSRLFARLQSMLNKNMIVVTDVGDSLFGAADLIVHHKSAFLSPAYYCSLGFAVPAALGVQMAAPGLRPLILVGDGAFQMTGMELSTVARFECNPIIILLNNDGYATERYIRDGSFNDLLSWNYTRLPDVLGAGRSFLVNTEGQLDKALNDALRHTDEFCLLEVRLGKLDVSATLQRIATGLRT